MRCAASLLALALVFFAPALPALAFGVSPPSISAEHLLKGSRYETTVFLVRGDAASETVVEATVKFPEEVRGWVTLDRGGRFTIPTGVQKFPVKVAIQVPEDTGLGIYDGSITFSTIPERKEGQQVVISVGVRLSMTLTVGEGVVKDFRITNVRILDVEEGDPPRVAVTIENTGNVPAAPDRATFDLFDKFGNTRLGFAQVEALPEAPPFETTVVEVAFPLGVTLGLGEYWGEAKIYRGADLVGNLKTAFNVVERSFNFLLWGGVALAVLLAGGAVLFLRRRGSRGYSARSGGPLRASHEEKGENEKRHHQVPVSPWLRHSVTSSLSSFGEQSNANGMILSRKSGRPSRT